MDKDKASHEGSIKHHGPIQVTIESPWSDYLIAIANQLHMPHSDIGQIVERFCASSLAAGYALTQIYPDDPDRQIIPDLATMNGHLWPNPVLTCIRC